MDVGLNNRNTLGDINPAFSDVVFFVEANSTERYYLWQEYSTESSTNIIPLSEDIINECPLEIRENLIKHNKEIIENNANRLDWKQVPMGFALTIGKIGKRPITLSFFFDIINGKKVCFYECASSVCDHTLIKAWLISQFQLTHDNYSRWNHTDAMNFHNCVNSLDNLDKEPRDTVYKTK